MDYLGRGERGPDVCCRMWRPHTVTSSIHFILTPIPQPTWTERAAHLGHAPTKTGLPMRTEQETRCTRPWSFPQKAGFPQERGTMVGCVGKE